MRNQLSRAELRAAIAEAAGAAQGVAAAYHYGSTAAGRATTTSDVDVAILLADPERDPVEARRVSSAVAGDLARRFPGRAFDVRDVEDLPLTLKGRVLTEGALVADLEPSRRVAFEVRTRMLYFDFLHFQRRDTREGLRALRELLGSERH